LWFWRNLQWTCVEKQDREVSLGINFEWLMHFAKIDCLLVCLCYSIEIVETLIILFCCFFRSQICCLLCCLLHCLSCCLLYYLMIWHGLHGINP
jgi:hypothetical protein